MTDSPAISSSTPLLIDARDAARLLGVSRSTFWAMLSAGRIPTPVFRAGRVVRWDRREIEQWVSSGCPSVDRWRVERGAKR